MHAVDVNYIAVVVVGVVLFVLGGLWYGALFSKRWVALMNKSEEELKKASSPVTYLWVLIAEIVVAYVLALFVGYAGATTIQGGLAVGALAWLGFAAATSFMRSRMSASPFQLWLINTGYTLLSLLVGGGILAVWH